MAARAGPAGSVTLVASGAIAASLRGVDAQSFGGDGGHGPNSFLN